MYLEKAWLSIIQQSAGIWQRQMPGWSKLVHNASAVHHYSAVHFTVQFITTVQYVTTVYYNTTYSVVHHYSAEHNYSAVHHYSAVHYYCPVHHYYTLVHKCKAMQWGEIRQNMLMSHTHFLPNSNNLTIWQRSRLWLAYNDNIYRH